MVDALRVMTYRPFLPAWGWLKCCVNTLRMNPLAVMPCTRKASTFALSAGGSWITNRVIFIASLLSMLDNDIMLAIDSSIVKLD